MATRRSWRFFGSWPERCGRAYLLKGHPSSLNVLCFGSGKEISPVGLGPGQKMKGYNATDLPAAERHLESAKTSILEAVRALGNHGKAQDLKEVAEQLGKKAKSFGQGMLLPGLKEPVVGPKGAA